MSTMINLLPPSKIRALQQGKILAYTQTMVFLVFLIALFVSATLFSVRMVVKVEYDTIKSQASGTGIGNSTEVASSVKEINSLMRLVNERQQQFLPWSEYLRRLIDLFPVGVRLEKISVSEDGRIALSGIAPTREDSLELLRRLKEADWLKGVNSPLSNILQKKDVKFDFEMRLVDAPVMAVKKI